MTSINIFICEDAVCCGLTHVHPLVVCVQSSVRKGVLPSMLEEILNTRIMVKQSMKSHKQDKALMRLLDARQLGLKLIANVTFGYTAANYSGRMPSVEVSLSELFSSSLMARTRKAETPFLGSKTFSGKAEDSID